MQITVTISASTPEEYRQALQTLANSVTSPQQFTSAEDQQAPFQQQAAERPARQARKAKDTATAAPAPKDETPFQAQVREAVQPDPNDDLGLDDQPEVTLSEVKAALGLFNGEHGAQKAREKLMAFKTVDGEPVKMLSGLQAKDYAAFVDSVS